ncbi:MAG: hypothetical protein Q9220_000559 [cf. Caloplaca sp. 1 TL-2023]
MFPRSVTETDRQRNTAHASEIGSPLISFSDTVNRLRELLTDLDAVIDEVPPDPGPRRFGNISFRQWYTTIEARLPTLLQRHLPERVVSFQKASIVGAKSELQSYLLGAFGSAQRLDYGTGHELSFLAFLGCIWKLGGFDSSSPQNEARGIVLGVIEPYLQLVRRLIKTYTLEPAGSHGVWGLDDHSFLPYLFGSAQYGPAISETDKTPVEGTSRDAPDPADVAKPSVVARERERNMYFSAIGFIYDVKKGPFWEHSPMLYDISGVRAGWAKINKGMIKMYMAEVLSKFPVVQHFYFGSLFSWDEDPDAVNPSTSIHTSSQPSRPSSSRPKPGGPISSVSQPEATPGPGPQKLNPPPGNFVGTAAPWARQSSAISPMTAFPSQTDQRSISQTPRFPSIAGSRRWRASERNTEDMPPPAVGARPTHPDA